MLAICPWPAFCLTSIVVKASPDQFTLRQTQNGRNTKILQMQDSNTGRTLWRRTFRRNMVVDWSKDRQAVVITDEVPLRKRRGYDLRVSYWRKGERLHSVLILPRWWESIIQIAWSPDKNRLLARASASGA